MGVCSSNGVADGAEILGGAQIKIGERAISLFQRIMQPCIALAALRVKTDFNHMGATTFEKFQTCFMCMQVIVGLDCR